MPQTGNNLLLFRDIRQWHHGKLPEDPVRQNLPHLLLSKQEAFPGFWQVSLPHAGISHQKMCPDLMRNLQVQVLCLLLPWQL